MEKKIMSYNDYCGLINVTVSFLSFFCFYNNLLILT